ncbi:60 kDa chaperonin, partial [Frankliniella fusca]
MEWYLVYTEKDKSLSIIDASAIVSAGDRSQMKFLKVHDHVTFVYAGASYMGVILGMSDSRVEIDELAKAEKIRMKQEKKENVDSSVSAMNQKRRSQQPPVKYGESGFDGPPASKKVNNSRSNRRTLPEQDESTRKRILELNKARADRAMSHSIIKSVNNKSAEDDPSYKLDSDDASDGSSSSEMCDFVQDSIRRKEERVQLFKSAKNSAGSSKAESASTASASPTKEELRRQLEEYKLKLQAAYG